MKPRTIRRKAQYSKAPGAKSFINLDSLSRHPLIISVISIFLSAYILTGYFKDRDRENELIDKEKEKEEIRKEKAFEFLSKVEERFKAIHKKVTDLTLSNADSLALLEDEENSTKGLQYLDSIFIEVEENIDELDRSEFKFKLFLKDDSLYTSLQEVNIEYARLLDAFQTAILDNQRRTKKIRDYNNKLISSWEINTKSYIKSAKDVYDERRLILYWRYNKLVADEIIKLF